MSTIKVDSITTRTGSGNLTLDTDTLVVDSTNNHVFIKKTSAAYQTVGHELKSEGRAFHTSSGGKALSLVRNTSNGAIMDFYNSGGTEVGSIETSASGIGIKLGGTASANLLDDYEEGTWTPVITGTSSAGSGTYSAQTATYTKIGRLVTFTFALGWTNHTGSGGIEIGGFPFSPIAQSYYLTQLEGISLTSNNFATFARIEASSNKGVMVQSPVAGGNRAIINMDTTGYVNGSGTFNTA